MTKDIEILRELANQVPELKAKVALSTMANRELRRQRDEYADCLRDCVDAWVALNVDGGPIEENRLDECLKRASELLAGG